jgi:hypothetical protein
MKYLRNRPFFVVHHIRRPRTNAPTCVKDWGKNNDNWQIEETVSFADTVAHKVLESATVIIDLFEGKLIKNRLPYDEQTVMQTYLTKYKDRVKDALSRWLDNKALAKAKAELHDDVDASA